jgi:hypothetical protein
MLRMSSKLTAKIFRRGLACSRCVHSLDNLHVRGQSVRGSNMTEWLNSVTKRTVGFRTRFRPIDSLAMQMFTIGSLASQGFGT